MRRSEYRVGCFRMTTRRRLRRQLFERHTLWRGPHDSSKFAFCFKRDIYAWDPSWFLGIHVCGSAYDVYGNWCSLVERGGSAAVA